MQILIAVAGWASAIIVVAAYALVSARKLSSDDPVFQLMNVAGGVGLAVNAAANHAWASTTVNVIWIGIGAVALGRAWRPHRALSRP